MEGITKLSKSWSQYELQIPSRHLNLEHFGIYLRKLVWDPSIFKARNKNE